MKTLKQTSQFKKDLKKIQNQPKKISALETVLKLLSQTGTLPKEYRPHWLTGDYKGYMECHIESDFLLIWIDENADTCPVRQSFGTFQKIKKTGVKAPVSPQSKDTPCTILPAPPPRRRPDPGSGRGAPPPA